MTSDATAYPRTFTAPGPLDVIVEVGGGHVTITATETNEATVTLRPAHVGDENALDKIARATVDLRGSTLYIDVPRTIGFRQNADVVVDATVPTASSVSARTASADVRLQGKFGDVDVKTGSGDVRGESGSAVKVGTGSGAVTLGAIGSAAVKTGSGDIAVDTARSDLTLSTASGDVRVGEVSATVTVTSASGGVDVGTLAGELRVKTASGDINIRRAAAGEMELKTASGRVTVAIAPGTAVLLDCSSITGRCRSGLTPTDGAEPADEERLELRARTVSGNIDITRTK